MSSVLTPSSEWFRDPDGSLGGFLLVWTWFPCSAQTGLDRVRFGAFGKCVSPGTPRSMHRTFPGPHTACRWCSKSAHEAAWRGPRGSGARRTSPAGQPGRYGVPSGHVSGAQDLPQGLSRPPLLLTVFFKCVSHFPAGCLPGL